MSKRTLANPWAILLLLCTVAQAQITAESIPTTRATTVLPAKAPGAEGLEIVGPSEADVGAYVHLEVLGLPPIDSSQTLEEALKWTKRIAMRVQQPPESEKVDFDVTLGFRLLPVLTWKLTLDLRAHVAGDYTVAFAMPGVDEADPVQLTTHGVRFGEGPIPPPPPTPDPVLEVTPQEPFSSTGPVGGPFDPASKSYFLKNVGEGNLVWGIKTTVPWLSASPSSGVIGPGQSTESRIVFSSAANDLSPGLYAGVVSFRNTTNGKGDSPRIVALEVTGDSPPPPINELWGVVIYETDDLDDYGPEMAQVIASRRIRELDNRFYFRIFDDDVKDRNDNVAAEAKPWIDLVRQKNLPMPHLFLIYEGGGETKLAHNAPLPDNVDETIALIRKYLPPKGEER